jgi:hypothetical protein
MKKTIYTILIALILSSCGIAKKVTKESTSNVTKTEKVEKTKDSTSVTEISRGINENISLSLRTNNKVVDSILKSRLKGFTSSKKSGGNSYSAKFDEEGMMLNIEALIEQSINERKSTNKDTKSEVNFTSEIDSYFSQKIDKIPWWFWAIVVLYFLPKILNGINTITNPVLTILKSIKNVK